MKVDLPASGMEGQLRTALSPGAGRGPCCDLDFLAALLEELQRASCQMAGINGEWGDPVTLPAGLEEPTLLEVPSEPGDDQILSGESVIPVLVPEIPGLPVPAGGVLAEGEAEAVAPAGLDLEAPGSLWPLDAGASPFELPARSHREAAEQALPGTEAVSSKPDQALAANQGQAIRPYGGAFLLDGTDYYQVLEADPQPVDPGSRRDGFFIQPDLHAEPGREVSGKLLDVNLEQGAVVGQSVNAGPVSLGAEGRQASGDPGWGEYLPAKVLPELTEPEVLKAGAGGGSPVFEDALVLIAPEVNGTGPGDNLNGTGKITRNLLDQLQARVVYLRESGDFPAEIRMKLEPPQLGEVLIRVVSRQGRLSAEIVTEIAAVKEMLYLNLDELYQRLDQINLQLDRIDLLTAGDLSSGAEYFSENSFQREQAGGRSLKVVSREEASPCPGEAALDGHSGAINCRV